MTNFYFDFKELAKIKPAFRIKQIKQAVFIDLIDSWDKATTLPADLRLQLNKKFPLAIDGEIFKSKDKGTTKALLTLNDGLKIETVLLQHGDKRNTICVSSQVGCPLGCLFCATGQMGFLRNLETYEIVEQVIFFARLLKQEGKKVTNIVFMGMGEPFLNYDNVMQAIKFLHDKENLNLGARHFSISTIGITDGINKLAKESLDINLAISLHAPTDDLRVKIVPYNDQYPITNILKTVDNYIKLTRRRVMFEYLMIKDFNDSEWQAQELAGLMKKPLYFVNLISYNATGKYKPSTGPQIRKFKQILEKEGIPVTQRYKFGQDIAAACGQLATECQ